MTTDAQMTKANEIVANLNRWIADRLADTTATITIVSGEGTGEGTSELYDGERTIDAIRARLAKERSGGDRWARAWIQSERGSRVDLETGEER